MEQQLKKIESEYLELLMLRSEPNEMYSSDTMDKMIAEKRTQIINFISHKKNEKELNKAFSGYDEALRIECEIKNILKRFNTENEKLDEVFFNVYSEEMKAIIKHFSK